MPAPKFCGRSGCITKVRGRTYCDEHTPEQWSGGHGSTRAWRTMRTQVLTEEPWCACGAVATEAGHIRARAHGGSDDRSNLTGQCTACNLAQMRHDRKHPPGG